MEGEPVNGEDSGEEYDLSQYDYLVGTLHYDPDDFGVFKCRSITAVDGDVVVYRSKYNSKSRTWGKVNINDPIHISDILDYHSNPTNDDEVNARLQEPTAAIAAATKSTKQRGRPAKK